MNNILFTTTNWELIPKIEYKGLTGTAYWQTIQMDKLRMRIVTYSKNYIADHLCQKGHLVYCLEGNFTSELENGESYILSEGMSYQVSDNLSCHKSITVEGAKLLIIDGDFLS